MKRAWSMPLAVSLAVTVAATLVVQQIMQVQAQARPAAESSAVSTQSLPVSVMKSAGTASYRLIDISHHDTVTDWNAVKNNVDGVYIKATESTNFVDPQMAAYAGGATKAGIPVGFYHYFQPAADLKSAGDQAQAFYNAIKGYGYKLVPVLDVEENNSLTADQICSNVITFANQFRQLSGQQIMIYASPKFADTYLNNTNLASYPLWVAHYNVLTPRGTATWNAYSMWQYDDSVTVSGISNPVDGDVATANVFLPTASSASSSASSAASSSVPAVPVGHTAQELMVR